MGRKPGRQPQRVAPQPQDEAEEDSPPEGRTPQHLADPEEEDSVPEVLREIIVLSDSEEPMPEPQHAGGRNSAATSSPRVPVRRLRVDEGNFGAPAPCRLPRTRWF